MTFRGKGFMKETNSVGLGDLLPTVVKEDVAESVIFLTWGTGVTQMTPPKRGNISRRKVCG